MPTPEQIQRVLELLEGVASRYGISDAFLVGGYPRAIAMGLGVSDVKDLDVASGTPKKATQLAGLVAEESGGKAFKVLHRTMTVNMEVFGVEVDFQGPMAHDEVLPYLHAWGVKDTPIAQNVFDRDFTINALAMPLGSAEILDLTRRGLSDIRERRVASILPADHVVPRNPLMITRAVKFAHKYQYRIDGKLWAAMKANIDKLLSGFSRERLAIEAFILSKYDCEDMLAELGLSQMSSERMIERGEEAVD